MSTALNHILVMGLHQAGKSSILKRLMNKDYDPNIKPTLGAQIHRLIIENTTFQVYDLGGQDRLRKIWFDKTLAPNAIVYVIDLTGTNEDFKIVFAEFQKILSFYFEELSIPDRKKIPLLILGNKIDLLQTDYIYLLKNIIFEIKKGINYKMGYCSAKNNEGITENFNWLVGEIVKLS